MGAAELAVMSIMATLASTGASMAQSAKHKSDARDAKAAAEAKAEAQRSMLEKSARERHLRGRSSTLTTPGGGLSESPTLGRPSLLGA